jgi:hypothetical protein
MALDWATNAFIFSRFRSGLYSPALFCGESVRSVVALSGDPDIYRTDAK